jgi:hypothetical protein
MKLPNHNRDVVIIAALLVLAIVAFHIASALSGYPFFRDQHLGAAIDYSRNGINWLNPVIPGFNANGLGTPQEIPIWQALASLPLRFFGEWWGWANLVSLVIFLFGIPPIWLLARRAMGERGAWWTVIAFLAQPLIFLTSGQASADGIALVAAIWAFYALWRLIETGSWAWFAAACLLSTLSALTKLPLFFCMGIASFFYLLLTNHKSFKTWLQLCGAGIFASLVFLAWSRMTDQILFAAEFPHEKLWLKDNPAMWSWYFGSWSYRLNPFNYVKGGWAALNCLLGSFFLLAGLLGGFLPHARRLSASLLAGAVVTTLVFSHLVLVHRHYYVLYSMGIALCLGAGLLWLEIKIHESLPKWASLTVPFLLAGALFLATIQGLMGMEVILNYDPYPKQMAKIIREHVAPNEKILIQGGGWGGQLLMISGRKGLSIWLDKTLNDPKNVECLKQLGYTKVVALSESPLLWALKVTNPGSANLKRQSYTATWSDTINGWPDEFKSDDILIKEIPK